MLKLQAFQDPIHQPFLFEGGKPAAILFHGFPGSPAEMRPIGKLLNSAGWTVKGILLPGFGPELNELNTKSSQDWISAGTSAIQDLAQTHKPVILIGFSMGAAISILSNGNQPVDATILISPFWKLSSPLWKVLPIIRFFIRDIRPFQLVDFDFNDQQVRQGIHNFMPDLNLDDPEIQNQIKEFSIPTTIISEIRKVGHKAYRYLNRLPARNLIVHGINDQLVETNITREYIRAIPGNIAYIELEAEHDLLNTDKPAWRRLEKLIRDFSDGIYSVDEND